MTSIWTTQQPAIRVQWGTRPFEPDDAVGALRETLAVLACCGAPFAGPWKLLDPSSEEADGAFVGGSHRRRGEPPDPPRGHSERGRTAVPAGRVQRVPGREARRIGRRFDRWLHVGATVSEYIVNEVAVRSGRCSAGASMDLRQSYGEHHGEVLRRLVELWRADLAQVTVRDANRSQRGFATLVGLTNFFRGDHTSLLSSIDLPTSARERPWPTVERGSPSTSAAMTRGLRRRCRGDRGRHRRRRWPRPRSMTPTRVEGRSMTEELPFGGELLLRLSWGPRGEGLDAVGAKLRATDAVVRRLHTPFGRSLAVVDPDGNALGTVPDLADTALVSATRAGCRAERGRRSAPAGRVLRPSRDRSWRHALGTGGGSSSGNSSPSGSRTRGCLPGGGGGRVPRSGAVDRTGGRDVPRCARRVDVGARADHRVGRGHLDRGGRCRDCDGPARPRRRDRQSIRRSERSRRR